MDIEQLKLVIDLLKTVSGDMETVALTYVAFLGAVGLFPYIVLTYLISTVADVVKKVSSEYTKPEVHVAVPEHWKDCIKEINRVMGEPGSDQPVFQCELDAIVNAVKVLKNESEKGTS